MLRSFKSVSFHGVLCCILELIVISHQPHGAIALGRDNTKCYSELGCFPNGYPWSSRLRPFPPPQTPQEINTKLICYTRESEEGKNVTLWPTISLDDCPFNPNQTTVFLYHGWCLFSKMEFCTAWMRSLKTAYLSKVDANVFLVEWLEGAESLFYLQVASNIRVVGAEVARFIKYLQKEYSFDPGKLHLIGNSLGPHAAGFTGKLIPGVGRITALDAAQPLFDDHWITDSRVRLVKTDAVFVDLIHTSSSPMLRMAGFGVIAPFGDVDFYINGGYNQPECSDSVTENDLSLYRLALYGAMKNQTSVLEWSKGKGCSHNRAIKLFTQAIASSNCTFWGHPTTTPQPVFKYNWRGKTIVEELVTNVVECDPSVCVPLGLDSAKYTARGSFIVNTTESSCT